MTPQERSLIDDLANKLAQANVGQKDTEAESHIQQEIGSRPDALYKLVQTVLVQNMALEQAKGQINDLQQKLSSAQSHPSGSTSFLGSLFGSHSSPPPPPPPQRAYQPAPQGAPQPGYQQASPGYAAPPPGYAPPPAGGGSSFLRSAATTAAGVAAGALAFEGIQSLLHGGLGGGFGHSGGMGSGFLGGSGQPGETVINNYYDSPDNQTDLADNTGDTYSDDPVDQVADADPTDDAGYDDTPVDSTDYSDTGDYSDSGGGDDSLV